MRNVQIPHLVLGIFFCIAGLYTLLNTEYIFSVWIFSLGIFFLFDSFKEILKTKLKPVSVKSLHHILGLIVILSGIISLSVEFGII